MTSKEFIRKVAFYRAFAGAVHLFCSIPDPDVFHGIWKVEIIGYDVRRTAFIPLLSDLTALVVDFSDRVKSIMIDDFDTLDLGIQLKYFKSFFNKCSEYQQAVIRQDPELSQILQYVETHETNTRKTPPVKGRVAPCPSEAATSLRTMTDAEWNLFCECNPVIRFDL